MRASLICTLVCTASTAVASPFKFPLGNGFPTPSKQAIPNIEERAGGSIPNTPLPTSLKAEGQAALELIALNEIFEVAYFTELLKNVTQGVPGYDKIPNKHYTMRSLRRIRAQEELHALGANAILESAGQKPIGGCEYIFPVTTFESAIALAEAFTEIVLGVLPEVQAIFAADGGDEAGLIPLIGSIIGQEAEQVGGFRVAQGKAPSSAPFLTGAAPQFALSILKTFFVPGSCKNLNIIDIPSFPPLTVETPPKGAKNQILKYSVEGTGISSSANSLAYIAGQNLPIAVPIKNVATKGGLTTFEAEFPFSSGGFAKGLTIAAVVKGTKKTFDSPTAVAEVAEFGPGVIELQ